ncbi:hypothetical protein BO71DRAFT_394052 [Aspergillus ellipticus CBS 707.79]|uniref:Uncharacterized protein n=1 Tax=Aspergillus ellipticus CBS 707.79 TaxID=1448320 RepID=A0A319DPI6_9EURO|nr:hypothetical protein BO71DRAFT_394052 [Aspergillus ellipticus CBS 707.79]
MFHAKDGLVLAVCVAFGGLTWVPVSVFAEAMVDPGAAGLVYNSGLSLLMLSHRAVSGSDFARSPKSCALLSIGFCSGPPLSIALLRVDVRLKR